MRSGATIWILGSAWQVLLCGRHHHQADYQVCLELDVVDIITIEWRMKEYIKKQDSPSNACRPEKFLWVYFLPTALFTVTSWSEHLYHLHVHHVQHVHHFYHAEMVQTKSQKEFRLTKSQMATKSSETSFGILSVGILWIGILSGHPVLCKCSVQLYWAFLLLLN